MTVSDLIIRLMEMVAETPAMADRIVLVADAYGEKAEMKVVAPGQTDWNAPYVYLTDRET